MSHGRQLLNRVAAAADLVAGLMMFVIFATLVAQTFMRYVIRSPLSTSQELASVAFIWMVFWAAGTAIGLREHIRFTMLYDSMPEQLRRAVALAVSLLYLIIFIWAARATWEYFAFLKLQFTASLVISYQLAFFPYFIFFAVFPIKILASILKLLGREWREAL